MPMVNSFLRDGVEYYQLYIGCPVCLMEGRPNVPEYWHHSKDGADMYIGDNGYYYCKDCGYTAPVINWAYECYVCKKAGHEKAVKLDNLKHVGEALSISGMVASTEAGLRWLARVATALSLQCE